MANRQFHQHFRIRHARLHWPGSRPCGEASIWLGRFPCLPPHRLVQIPIGL
jgi:hypothetical protein